MSVSFHRLGSFFAIMSSCMSLLLLSLFSVWNPYNATVSTLDIVPEVS